MTPYGNPSTQFFWRLFVREIWEQQGALRRRKTGHKGELPRPAPFSPMFQWLGLCGHSRPWRCGSALSQCAFRRRPAKILPEDVKNWVFHGPPPKLLSGFLLRYSQTLDGPRGCFWRVSRGCPCGEGYYQGLKSCRVARSFIPLQSGSQRKKSKINFTSVGAIPHKCARYALGRAAFAGLK
jgi:hypothetical protein